VHSLSTCVELETKYVTEFVRSSIAPPVGGRIQSSVGNGDGDLTMDMLDSRKTNLHKEDADQRRCPRTITTNIGTAVVVVAVA
jgi:hypothetical protein